MTLPFPFNLPAPTAFYLTLYVLTFALHQAFMHYVLAGSLYVAWTTTFPGRGTVSRNDQPIAATLRDWQPFLLSAAITAGVAPLLFIQIVYQKQFYTANLLLWWRWMIVVPVLIVAFYLLYLLKSKLMARWPHAVRSLVAIGTAACFVFVGFCWTANHLLSVSESRWPQVYVTNDLSFLMWQVLPRMSIWLCGSFLTLPAILAWQMLRRQSERSAEVIASVTHNLSRMADTACSFLVLIFVTYQALGREEMIRTFESRSTVGYALLAFAGMVVLRVGWIVQLKRKELSTFWSAVVTAGTTVALLGICFARESIRARTIDMPQLYQRHADAAQVGGFPVFLVFTVLVSVAMAWCFVTVSRGLRINQDDESS